MTDEPIHCSSPHPTVASAPEQTRDGPPLVVGSSPRAPRGFIIGALVATPLWFGLLLLARHLYAWVR